MEDFSQFITNCLAQGYNSPTDWCRVAKERVAQLDEKIKELEQIRIQQANYRQFIKQLGGEIKIKESLNNNIFSQTEDEQLKETTGIIIEFLQKMFASNIPIQPRNIIDGTQLQSKWVFLGIKYLYDQGILARAGTPGREIIAGPNWKMDA